jgi:hypothetical protein
MLLIRFQFSVQRESYNGEAISMCGRIVLSERFYVRPYCAVGTFQLVKMNLDFCDACEISTGKFESNRFGSSLKPLLCVTQIVLNCVARDTERPYMNRV